MLLAIYSALWLVAFVTGGWLVSNSRPETATRRVGFGLLLLPVVNAGLTVVWLDHACTDSGGGSCGGLFAVAPLLWLGYAAAGLLSLAWLIARAIKGRSRPTPDP